MFFFFAVFAASYEAASLGILPSLGLEPFVLAWLCTTPFMAGWSIILEHHDGGVAKTSISAIAILCLIYLAHGFANSPQAIKIMVLGRDGLTAVVLLLIYPLLSKAPEHKASFKRSSQLYVGPHWLMSFVGYGCAFAYGDDRVWIICFLLVGLMHPVWNVMIANFFPRQTRH